jgi:hypothetical protein
VNDGSVSFSAGYNSHFGFSALINPAWDAWSFCFFWCVLCAGMAAHLHGNWWSWLKEGGKN